MRNYSRPRSLSTKESDQVAPINPVDRAHECGPPELHWWKGEEARSGYVFLACWRSSLGASWGGLRKWCDLDPAQGNRSCRFLETLKLGIGLLSWLSQRLIDRTRLSSSTRRCSGSASVSYGGQLNVLMSSLRGFMASRRATSRLSFQLLSDETA